MKFDPKWSLLRAFGNSRFARLTVLVPIFGYLIVFNDAFVSLVSTSADWACVAFQNSVCEEIDRNIFNDGFLQRRIINIYVALSLIAVSTLVYQVFCPHEISKFWHVESYVAEQTRVFHPEFNRQIRKILDKQKPEKVNRIQAQHNKYKQFDRPKASEMYDRDILSLWFSYQNQKFKGARWICFTLFGIGSILLAYPTIIVFVSVAKIAVLG